MPLFRRISLQLYSAALLMALLINNTAYAGLADWYNGVSLNKPLPEHNFQYLNKPEGEGAKLRLIDFWATWCIPCVEAIPKLNELQAQYKDKGLAVTGVTREKKELVVAFLETHPMNYASALEGEPDLGKALKVKMLPYAIFVDSKGIIVWRGQPEEINSELMEKLLKE